MKMNTLKIIFMSLPNGRAPRFFFTIYENASAVSYIYYIKNSFENIVVSFNLEICNN